jgi:hypothetical protein
VFSVVQRFCCWPLAGLPLGSRVECKGDFQVTKYGLLATPYCEEENIAIVAQSYGWQVTGFQVRKNPLKKVYICQVLGRDIRLKGSCAGYSPDAYARVENTA